MERAMKAIIEIGPKNAIFIAAREQLAAAGRGEPVDYRLSFESARTRFWELTPARMDLLRLLRQTGLTSVLAL